MLINYFKIAWRNLIKNKVFSFINIFGFCAGLASCMLITLYIIDELNFDRHHVNGENIYQLATVFIQQGKETRMPNTPAPMALSMQRDFPEVVNTTRLLPLFAEDRTLLQYRKSGKETVSFYESKGYMADSTFFDLFTYHFVEGIPGTALRQPNSLVLREDIAKKLLGDEPAIFKTIHIVSSTNGSADFTVTGVFAANRPSHIDAGFFMSMQGGEVEKYINENGKSFATNNMFYTYLQLRAGSDPKKTEAKFPAFLDKYAGDDLKAMGFGKKQFLVALKDIHLRSGMEMNVTPPGSAAYLYILASIALFTLSIAIINFMNLSTARSSKRSTEVGIRKVLGAEKYLLIRQFLGESMLVSLIAFIFSLLITAMLLPAFNMVSGKHLSLAISENYFAFAGFFMLSVFSGLLAGTYPAFYLSSFRPVRVLKGSFVNSLSAVSLRKGLVVFQFIISVALITSFVIINNQMKFLRSADLGFTKESQIVIPLQSAHSKSKYQSIKQELIGQTQVINVGASLYYPGIANPSDNLYYKKGESMKDAKRVRMNWIDDTYLQTLNIQSLAGRLFSDAYKSDTNFRIILNESAIKEIGLGSPQNALGQNVYFDYQGKQYAFNIIGVVKDFHFEDLHLPITPYGFQLIYSNDFNYMIIHARSGNLSPLLSTIKNIWNSSIIDEPFSYSFLDETFQKNYEAEDHLSAIVGYFTFVAILISCLGLFGLAAFSSEQRTKEIGVRKVLGASVGSIIALLSKDFLKLVLAAIVIASPVAWYVMNKWLQDFAYHVSIGWLTFAFTAVIALSVALLTISFQAFRAAVANPVKSLRSE
jgi:putative ABC transport system permease protein